MGITRKPLSLAKTSKKITKLSTTDYDQYLMASCKSGKASLDPGDWRTQLRPETRRRIVNRIINTLKRGYPFSGLEGSYQLERTATRVEEEEYTSATSQTGYIQQLCIKLLSMESDSERVPYLFPFTNAGNSNRFPNSASVGSTMQTGHANGGDWQEEIYHKIKAMKDVYLLELIEMNLKISIQLLQYDLLPQQQAVRQIMELRISKSMLEHILVFLQVPKDSILPSLKEKLGPFEMQIINLINANRCRQPVPPLQQRLLPFHMHSIQRPLPRNLRMQSRNLQGSVATMPWNNMIPPRNLQTQSRNLQGSVATMPWNNMIPPRNLQMQSKNLQGSVATGPWNNMTPPRNLQMQSRNLQGSVATMPWNNMASFRHSSQGPVTTMPWNNRTSFHNNSISFIPRVSTAQQNMLNSLQLGPNLNNSTESFPDHPLPSNNAGTSNRPLNSDEYSPPQP